MLRSLLVLLCAALLPACAALVDYQGNAAPEDALARITPQVTPREEVVKILGTPTATSMDGQRLWLYISREVRTLTFFAPRESRRRVVAIHFGENGRVEKITSYNRKDGRQIAQVGRQTPSPNQPPSLLSRIFGNIGVVRPAGVADDQ